MSEIDAREFDECSGSTDTLVARIEERLEERGVPEGAWLIEIAQVRTALQTADDLLRRMENAIVRKATEKVTDIDSRVAAVIASLGVAAALPAHMFFWTGSGL